MKKTYVTPKIFFESFTLNTAIAGDCEVPFDLQAKGICAIPSTPDIGLNIFNISAVGTQCKVQGGDTATYNGLCYHIPDATNNLFNS